MRALSCLTVAQVIKNQSHSGLCSKMRAMNERLGRWLEGLNYIHARNEAWSSTTRPEPPNCRSSKLHQVLLKCSLDSFKKYLYYSPKHYPTASYSRIDCFPEAHTLK